VSCRLQRRLFAADDGLDGIGVDSGMLAVVDAAVVDRFLAEMAPRYYGSGPPIGPDGVATPDGILIDAGGDDVFAYQAEMCDLHAHTFWVELDEAPTQARWQAVGKFTAPSGVLLVGDPEMLEQYVPHSTTGPVSGHGPWTVLAVPTGSVDVHMLRDLDSASPQNRALRLTTAP
jgi:hypothetical protein